MNTLFSDPDYPPSLSSLPASYGYAALLDAEGNEQPITDNMIRSACEQALDALSSFLPPVRNAATCPA
jgi:hypothetical protein